MEWFPGARQCPSPNFNERPKDTVIDLLVIHGISLPPGEFGGPFIDQLFCNRLNPCDHPYFVDIAALQVSSHLLIRRDGTLVQYVPFSKRAWHAGVSSWQGDDDLNSRSIGIEIVNGGHDWPMAGGVLAPYPNAQIEALISLCSDILLRWDIPYNRIVGHSDIAPARKDDPGEHFPWDRLARAGIGKWPLSISDNPAVPPEDGPHLIGRGLGPGDDKKAVGRMQGMLAEIGYGLEPSGVYDSDTEAVVRAFQRRWLQDQVTGWADLRTLQMIGLVHPLFGLADSERQ